MVTQRLGRFFGLFILCAVLSLILSGCGGQTGLPLPSPFPTAKSSPTLDDASRATRIAAGFTPTSPPTNTPFPIVTITPTPENNTPLIEKVDPLTGKKLPAESGLSRPLLIKLANWPESLRPASGLNQADMVFEYYIGHQMNHLLALYSSSNAPFVAPMAPARPFDMTLTDLYQANLAVAGAEPSGEYTLLKRFPDRVALQNFVPCPAVCADFGREEERTAADTVALKKYFASEQTDLFIPDLAVNAFASQAPVSSELANIVSVEYADFSVMQWRFNEASSLYELWQDHRKENGKYELIAAMDEADGNPIAFENIVIVYSKYIEYKSNSYDVTLVPGARPGQAVFFRDGRVSFGRWQITEPNHPLQFRNLDDSLYGLKPGSTWIVFVTETSKSNQPAPGEWQIAFSIK